ncbi:nitrate- and nitrite sensing domain-containing protein [Photobacterium alginatilyticum]|uniref:nitrate- and nitrite sensing domain-containing protein n=1 Tax=Photobacterium alginatilyticum TaxID=1775171 RepID=UPI0040688C7A
MKMQFSVKTKLMILIIPILVALILSTGTQILEAHTLTTSANNISHLVKLSAYSSQLVHELQKERGYSAGFIGSNGKNFSSKLKPQQNTTDKISKSYNHIYTKMKKNFNTSRVFGNNFSPSIHN